MGVLGSVVALALPFPLLLGVDLVVLESVPTAAAAEAEEEEDCEEKAELGPEEEYLPEDLKAPS